MMMTKEEFQAFMRAMANAPVGDGTVIIRGHEATVTELAAYDPEMSKLCQRFVTAANDAIAHARSRMETGK